MIASYQKNVTVEKLKKTYSALAQTTNRAITDYGPIMSWEIYDTSTTVPNTTMNGSEHFARTYLMPYMNVLKVCNDSSCRYKTKMLNGENLTIFNDSNCFIFYLNDGTSIGVYAYNKERMTIYVDINGQKGPNIRGRDIFNFRYHLHGSKEYGKFIPSGSSLSISTLINEAVDGCNKKASGYYCTTIIMKSGWTIPKEYPW